MAIYCVNYDLRQPKRDYDGLKQEIGRSKASHRVLESTWLVETDEAPADLTSRLKNQIDQDDLLFVIDVGTHYDGVLPDERWDWIKEHLPALATNRWVAPVNR